MQAVLNPGGREVGVRSRDSAIPLPAPAPWSRGAGGQHLGAMPEGGTHNSIA